MLTLLAYARFAETLKMIMPRDKFRLRGKIKTKIFYGLALLFFVLGLMSKPMLVTLPFVLLLLDFWPLQRFRTLSIQRLVLEKTPFFLLSGASCVITFVAQKQGEAVQTLAAFPLGTRIENALISCATYLVKTFWPAELAVPYPYSSHWPAMEIIVAGILIIGASAASLFCFRKLPFLTVGWFWFLGMLVPVIGLVQVGIQAMADRYTYLPLIGFFILAAWGLDEVSRRWNFPKAIMPVAAILILIACALQTRRQIRYWQNTATLFQHAIAITKNNAEAYDHLGTFIICANKAAWPPPPIVFERPWQSHPIVFPITSI